MYKKIRGLCILVGMMLLGSHTTVVAQESRMHTGMVQEEEADCVFTPEVLAESEVIGSGALGMKKTITYTFTADGVLTLSGEGKLSDLTGIPYFDDIVHVIIEDGITDIGYKTFKGAPKLVSVTMADSITEIGNTAFSGCTSLETVKLSDGLTELPLSLFYQCSSLKEVTLPENLKTIGNYCFRGCSSLTEVTLPEGIVTIEKECFRDCAALERIVALSDIQDIKEGAFYGCLALKHLDLGEGLKSIGNNGFTFCSSLEELSLGNQIESIGEQAFSYCDSLKRMEIPDSVKNLETANLFNNCSSLKEVVFPKGLKSLGDSCFYKCTSLEEITIPEGVSSIGVSCFKECTSLTSVELPDSITDLRGYSFAQCTALKEFPSLGNVKILYSYSFEGCTALAEIRIGSKTEVVGAGCFKDCTGLKKLVFDEGENCTLQDDVFKNCSSLEEIEFANRVTAIGEECFLNCSSLKTVILNENLSSLGEKAFNGCSGLENICYNVPQIPEVELGTEWYVFDSLAEGASVTIGSNVEVIPSGLFHKVNNLKSIEFQGTNLKKINSSAFSGCKQLEELYLPDSVEEIGAYAFYDCSSLATIQLGDGVSKIGAEAFGGTPWLETGEVDGFVIRDGILLAYTGKDKEIHIPDTVEHISDGVFSSTYNRTVSERITKVIMPSSVKTIGKLLFNGCYNLEEVVLSENITEIPDNCFSGCNRLTSVNIPKKVEYFGKEAFSGCGMLETMVIPESITEIKVRCFSGCSGIKQIHIPDNVKTIRTQAFSGCLNLSEITGGYGVEEIEEDVFAQTPWYENSQDSIILGACLLDYVGTDAEVIIPEGVRVICESAFIYNTTITSVTFPDSLEIIEETAFSDCSNLETIHWGKGLKVLEEGAFQRCKLTEELRFPQGLEKIGSYTILTSNVKEIWIPASVKEIERGAFQAEYTKIHFEALECNDILSVMEKYGENPIKGSQLIRKKLEDWYTAERINFTSTEGNTIMSQVARLRVRQLIESGEVATLKDAYDWVCRNCGYTLDTGYHYSYADGPLFIGVASCQGYALMMKAFLDEMGYPNFVMEGTVTGVYGTRTHAWNNVCISGSWYHMDATDTRLGDYSTYMLTDTGTHSVEGANYRYIWRGDIESQRTHALENYEASEETQNPLTYALQEDGTYQVTECSNMATEVMIPAMVDGVAVTSISENAFKNCYYLEKVTIPEGIQTIGASAFLNCIDLKEIKLPSTIKELGNGAFDHCISLRMANLSEIKETELNGVFHCCISLRNIRLPKSLEVIDSLAFMGCTDTLLDGAPGLEISGYSNTIAETFAAENELPFVSLGEGPISLEEAELTIEDATYTGEALYPQVTVVLDGVTLKKDEDYSVEYSNNIEVGNGAVTITGIGNYKGKVQCTFEITADDTKDDAGDDTDDEPKLIFADVAANSWQYPFAKYAYEKNIMKGKNTDAEGRVIFAPNDNLTRAEFAQVLYNAENKPSVEYSDRFHDVPKGQWYANAVLWAAANDIVSGYPNGNYGVSDPITREQLAMMLYKYAKLKGYDITTKADLTGFTDYQSISSWAVTPMEWAVGNSVMKGKKEKLDPTGKATRAECATMLTNFMNTFGE